MRAASVDLERGVLDDLRGQQAGGLAQLRPGETCQFKRVSAKEARSALLLLEEEVARTMSSLRPLHRKLSSKNLLGANLIGGVCDTMEGEPDAG